jgi:hypothetical protein
VNKLRDIYKKAVKNVSLWVPLYSLQFAVFNIILIFLFLLRSVGYFDPFLPLSVNFIVLISFILAIVLFRAESSVFFTIGLLFWVFAAFLRIVKVDIWAERTSVYVFESLLIGITLLIFESFSLRRG